MTNMLKAVFGIFWLISTLFVAAMVFVVLQTEHNPQLIWAWLVMCAFTFIAATWLSYNVVFSHYQKPGPGDTSSN